MIARATLVLVLCAGALAGTAAPGVAPVAAADAGPIAPRDVVVFNQRIITRLVRYRADFERAAREHAIPWTLLAALAYQESQWNPVAKSPTGVRGMMMLTRGTAREVGVRDRTDARESIRGGARYLAYLRSRLPRAIVSRDQLLFAAASYNVGFGHVARVLSFARDRDRPIERWSDVTLAQPLLERAIRPRVRTAVGRVRSAVHYVRRVRAFEQWLERHLIETAKRQ